MWIVAKYKNSEQNIFLQNISKKVSGIIKIFNPKIKINSYKKNRLVTKEKPLLNNYLFCFHPDFSDSNVLKSISTTIGLMYLLKGSDLYQDEIENFIKYYKSHEDENGYVKQSFLDVSHNKFYKFTSGPFTNLIFRLIDKNKNKIQILIGNVKTVINKNTDYSYQSI